VFEARAHIYLKANQLTLALRDAERAVSLDPFDEKFLETRAQVYEALGRNKEAIADYRRIVSSNPSMQSAIDGLRRLGASPPPQNEPADAARKVKSSAKPLNYAPPPAYPVQPSSGAQPPYPAQPPPYSREEIECERARHADPAGRYAGFPCWAREAFSPRGRR
jgi:tetratricopeptide (TPR) repeat protein